MLMTPELAQAAIAQLPANNAGYGFSLSDAARFDSAMQQAGAANTANQTLQVNAVGDPGRVSPALESLMTPFEHINTQAKSLESSARSAAEAESEMTPGEMVMLTVRCHEFMFNCQLTSNIANRTSDGLQQLFKQQS
jgi:hypothetical protein